MNNEDQVLLKLPAKDNFNNLWLKYRVIDCANMIFLLKTNDFGHFSAHFTLIVLKDNKKGAPNGYPFKI